MGLVYPLILTPEGGINQMIPGDILPVNRGGTGLDSYNALKSALGLAPPYVRTAILLGGSAVYPLSNGGEYAKTDTITNGVPIAGALFTNSTSDRFAYWYVPLPDAYTGEAIKASVIYTPYSASSENGTELDFGISLKCIGSGISLDSAPGPFTTIIQSFQTGVFHPGQYICCQTTEAEITPGGSPAGGKLMQVCLKRLGTDSAGIDFLVLALKLEYPVGALSD